MSDRLLSYLKARDTVRSVVELPEGKGHLSDRLFVAKNGGIAAKLYIHIYRKINLISAGCCPQEWKGDGKMDEGNRVNYSFRIK